MATLKDIARATGLSVTQVSRALNGHSDVNEETRLRVQEAANAMDYQPNVSARKLVSGRSGMVGLVVPNHAGLTQDLLFLEVVTGLSQQFSGRGMQLVLHIAQAEEEICGAFRRLISGGALDGFVLTDPTDSDARVELLSGLKVPFVLHGRTGDRQDYPFFDIDNHRLLQELTTHLTGLGHRQIALLNGVAGRSYVSARTAGYHKALAEAGIEPHPGLIHFNPMDEAHGLVSTIRLMSGQTPQPTAIICGNILIAKGVYRALESMSLRVPQDVSVVAHDDLLPNLRASAFYPALTVTKSPLRDSWLPLADFLAGALEGKPLADLQRVADYEFIRRNSAAPPPAGLQFRRF